MNSIGYIGQICTESLHTFAAATPGQCLIEFDSIEKAQAWYKSAAQKDVDTIRAKSTNSLAFIIEGLGK